MGSEGVVGHHIAWIVDAHVAQMQDRISIQLPSLEVISDVDDDRCVHWCLVWQVEV